MELFCSWRLNRSSHASLINVTGWLSFYKYLCVVFSLHLEWFNDYTVDRIRYTVLPEIEINLALWNFKKLLTLWNVDHVINLLQKLCVHYGLSVIYVWIAHVGPQLNVLLFLNVKMYYCDITFTEVGTMHRKTTLDSCVLGKYLHALVFPIIYNGLHM
jgi:hypothetical protein